MGAYYTSPQTLGYTNGSSYNSSHTQLHHRSAFNPSEAWNMDKKIDDGAPGLGKIHAGTACNISASTNTTTAEYNLADDSISCPLRFTAD